MKRKFKYDPEDLESLLLNKRFDELYPEEREFVLRHMDSAEEYASMRKTLLSIVEQPDSGSPLKPRSSTKRKLMREFEEDRTAAWQVWLNGIFLPFNRKPVLSYSLVAVVLIAGGLFFFSQQNADKVLLADNKEQPKEQKQETDEAEDLEKNLEPNDNSSEDSKKELSSADMEDELEEELPPVGEPEPTPPETAQEQKIEVNENVEEDAVMDLQVAHATEKSTKDTRPQADSEVSNEKKVSKVELEPVEISEELAEVAQPQTEEEELVERSVNATEINTDSFMTDDQMGNMAETTTIQSQSRRIKTNVQSESTSMSKAAFLLQNLHTSM